MGNSTITLSSVIDDAATLGDTAPVIASGGFSDTVALSISNDVIAAMLNGSKDAEPFNWKFNRFNVTPFLTISYQQDYFIPGNSNLGWLENCWAINVNQTSNPKQKIPMEVRRDLDVTSEQTGKLDKICWLPNKLCQTTTWGQAPLGPTAGQPNGQIGIAGPGTGLQNPGPSVIYTNPLGLLITPTNPGTALTDPNGNLWVVTTYGVCGTVQPTWPVSPTYPTFQSPNTVSSTVTDGTVVWTAIDPNGQGLRLDPIPPQNGVVWMITPIGQMRIPTFKKLGQTLDPIPDDYSWTFKDGFFAQCIRRNPDPKVRARFKEEYAMWMKALHDAVSQGNRERDDYGFYPSTAGVMDVAWGNCIRPDRPYNF